MIKKQLINTMVGRIICAIRNEINTIKPDIKFGYTFDDILLVPDKSAILPPEADVRTRLSRNISLNIPIVSAAMDTVTESETAITMARQGGIGIIHKNMDAEEQSIEVEKVKKSESGMIIDPITIEPEEKICEVLNIMKKYKISGVPVIKQGYLVGIITNRDLRFETNLDQVVETVMTKENLVTALPGIGLEEAKAIMHKRRIEKLLIVDGQNKLKGLITIKDILKIKKFPLATKDELGRLRVGAAVGVESGMIERIDELIKAGVDAVVIDTAHGHSKIVLDFVRAVRNRYNDLELIAGNVATAAGTKELIEAGVDAVKVGVGPGSICTTRVVAGIGVPQLTAIMDCAKAAKEYGIPVIADGGIKYSGDITKALFGGADSVMIGGLFAGTEESPGETILFQGRSYKVYRGMGSIDAMKERGGGRYFQEGVDEKKLVPQGIVGRVPCRGHLADTVYQLVGGLQAGMGYLGCGDIEALRTKPNFIQISPAGLRESHVRVDVIREAPNYRTE